MAEFESGRVVARDVNCAQSSKELIALPGLNTDVRAGGSECIYGSPSQMIELAPVAARMEGKSLYACNCGGKLDGVCPWRGQLGDWIFGGRRKTSPRDPTALYGAGRAPRHQKAQKTASSGVMMSRLPLIRRFSAEQSPKALDKSSGESAPEDYSLQQTVRAGTPKQGLAVVLHAEQGRKDVQILVLSDKHERMRLWSKNAEKPPRQQERALWKGSRCARWEARLMKGKKSFLRDDQRQHLVSQVGKLANDLI